MYKNVMLKFITVLYYIILYIMQQIFFFSLLMYGLILAGEQNYEEAEIFLRAVTDFYPRFVEGWVILHLFYIRTNYTPGITRLHF